MKSFIITEQQINSILAVIGKFPAEQVFNSIVMLQGLSEYIEPRAEESKGE